MFESVSVSPREQDQEHGHDDQELDQGEAALVASPAQLIGTVEVIGDVEPVDAEKLVRPVTSRPGRWR